MERFLIPNGSCTCAPISVYLCNGLNFVLGRTTSVHKSALRFLSWIRSENPIWKLALFQSCSPRIKERELNVLLTLKNVRTKLSLKSYNEWKPVFFWEWNLQPAFWWKLKKKFFWQILLQISHFLRVLAFLAHITLKIHISKSNWSAQHPNAGLNIQQVNI